MAQQTKSATNTYIDINWKLTKFVHEHCTLYNTTKQSANEPTIINLHTRPIAG